MTIIFIVYGFEGVGKDAYIHITTTFILSSYLIRINEANLRISFNLLTLDYFNVSYNTYEILIITILMINGFVVNAVFSTVFEYVL